MAFWIQGLHRVINKGMTGLVAGDRKVRLPEQLHIIGHCNGIVLLYSKSSFVLCNPGIEEFIRVPDETCLPMWPRLDLDPGEDYNWPEHIDPGFGYDPKSTSTNLWPLLLMCFKGMRYWLGIEQDKEISVYDTFDDPEGERVIISFHTSHEVFRGIPESSELQRLPLRHDLDLKLIVWNESVSYGSQ
ncbi:uncharacterized protein [Malus domestica]|uniref:uncharacterized protein n=1 Tax=Malus domestica TaxID=3750 RepID=UPI0039760367